MTEWNGDPQWWQNGVQIKANEPPVAPAPRAYSNSGAAQPATSHFAVEVHPAIPASPPANKQDLKDSKKYKTDPPVKRQPWFEFLVSVALPMALCLCSDALLLTVVIYASNSMGQRSTASQAPVVAMQPQQLTSCKEQPVLHA